MIFRLEYKNKALKTARVDIITPTGTGVETVEGTGYPFMWKYEGDKKNKSLMFLSSSAEINIYETPLFNIDTLKTSGEKDIRVNYYIDSVLEWTGFVIPDFFSREIGGDGVVSMVASDRLSVLDSEVLEGLPVTVTLRTLLSSCLAKTGLALPLKTVVDFATVSGNTNHILNHSIRSQRLTDTKGRSVNCKDIIKSILVATNSKLMQRKGAWWVINKMQHELGGGRVYTSPTAFTNYVENLISFTDVTRGAIRTIAPVAGGVGVFQEYGGGALAPDNYAFENGLSGWTLHSGFTASTDTRRVLGYTKSGKVYTPIYDAPGTARPYLLNRNLRPADNQIDLTNIYTIPHAKTSIPVVSSSPFSAKIKVEVNATGRGGGSAARFVVMLKRPGRDSLILNRDGQWLTGMGYKALLFATFTGEDLEAVDGDGSYSGTIEAAGDEGFEDDINDYSIDLLIFGSGRSLSDGTTVVRDETVLINSASVQFSAASNDTPKGTLYKADQGGESYTKIHDTETTIFGDYLTGGLNGYFYNYAPDDTSSLLAPNGSRSQPAWVNTYTQNTEPLPLLQQTIRQMRRMFSVAHDFIKGEIDVADFDPLSIFEDCERRFVIVEAEFDFLRGSLQVVLEEVAYQNLTVREYIYSYFGEGDEGIRGISGISAGSSGGGGGGGGMAPGPSWLENEITIDPESGLLSVDGWHVKGDLIIEGQVNQWLAQQLVVDDARIQVNRRQGGATVDSGLVIYDKDTGTEVSSLVYDVDGIWRATGAWQFNVRPKVRGTAPGIEFWQTDSENAARWVLDNDALQAQVINYNTGAYISSPISFDIKAPGASMTISGAGDLGIAGSGSFGGDLNLSGGTRYINLPTTRIRDNNGKIMIFSAEGGGQFFFRPSGDATGADQTLIDSARLRAPNLEIPGTSTLTGSVTAGGNVGTSNFASQLQGWRVTPQGQADFRHIYTDELQAKAFTADISQALVGSDVLTKSVAKLAQNFTVTANGTTAPLYVEELEGFAGMQVFAVNDILLIRIFDRSGGGLLIKNVWVKVTSYVGTTNNVQQFTVNVINSGGIAGLMAYAGSMILDYGQSGSGLIQRTVLDQQGSPYSRVTTWVNNPWTPENFTLHYQSGNLNGLANAEGWGVYSQNSFLTGKLLVGDLTKAGQYMEYDAGLLKVKGRIEATEGYIGTVSIENGGIGVNLHNNKFIGMISQTASNAIIGGADSYLRRGFGMYHYDSATVPGGFKLMRMGVISDSNSSTNFPATPEYGFQIRLAATTNDVFRVGNSGAFIAGINFDDSRIFTQNWWLNKDGSFYFGAGGTIDGGLITGIIESSNFNGTVGSRFDLHNGHLQIGDAIRMSGDTSEIQVKDRDTGLSSFKIGDFPLTPPDFAGGGVNVLLSSSAVTASAAAGSYQLNRTVYVSGYGAFLTSAANISNSLIVGGAYNLFAYLKVVLSQHTLVETMPGYIMSEGFYRRSGRINMQLKNGNTVVWEQNLFTIPSNGVIPLSIETPFQAVSPSLRLIITIDGEFEYRQPYSSGTRLYNTGASIERFDSSARLVLQSLIARMEFSTKGMQAVFSSINYFRCSNTSIEGRGNQTFISPNGVYRLRVSNTGIEKSTDGGINWTPL